MAEGSHVYTTHLYRVDTTSTNATEDNLPGPGRGLDKLFQRGGRRLERLLSSVTRPTQQTSLVKLQRTDTVSTNATEDNLIGPGRGLDNLFQASGKKFERLIGTVAHRNGYGPAAVEKRIVVVMYRLRESGRHVERRFRAEEWRRYTENDKQKMDKEVVQLCKRLMKHLSSPVASTQKRALSALVEIIATDPTRAGAALVQHYAMADILSLHQLLKFLSTRPQIDSASLWKQCYNSAFDPDLLDDLLFDSRKALFACSDNQVNRVMKTLSEMSQASATDSPPDRVRVRSAVKEFSRFLLDPELSILAITYINADYSPLSTFTRTGNDEVIDVDVQLELLRKLCSIYPSQLAQATDPTNCELASNLQALIRRADVTQRFLPPDKRIRGGLSLRNTLQLQRVQPIDVNVRELCRAVNLITFDLQDYVASYYFAALEDPLACLERRFEEILTADLPTLQTHDASYIDTLHCIYSSLEREAALECTVADEFEEFSEGFRCEKCARAAASGSGAPSDSAGNSNGGGGNGSGRQECRHISDAFTDDLVKRNYFQVTPGERVALYRSKQTH